MKTKNGTMPNATGAGGGIRARDFWTQGVGLRCSPDYESGALARLGYPGNAILDDADACG